MAHQQSMHIPKRLLSKEALWQPHGPPRSRPHHLQDIAILTHSTRNVKTPANTKMLLLLCKQNKSWCMPCLLDSPETENPAEDNGH